MNALAPLDWLLEDKNPSARYLTLRYLLDRPEADAEVAAARAAIAHMPQVRAILDAQYPAGHWVKPDRGYSPRYKATIWQLIQLADLGMACTEAIARGCEHVLSTALHPGFDLFSAHQHSTGVYPCLNGDLLRAMWHFGYGEHEAVRRVATALAQRVLDNGWTCPRNGAHPRQRATWLPCVWGCVKVLRGLGAIPAAQRSTHVDLALTAGINYLCSQDLSRDQRPELVDEPSHWLRLGFPTGYGSDLLEALVALVELDVAVDLPETVRVVRDKRDAAGRWSLEYALPNTWTDYGLENMPNKWVTLRALRVLRHLDL